MAEDRKKPKNPFSAVRAAEDLRKRKHKVREEIEKAEGTRKKPPKKKAPPRKRRGTTYEEAKRTKHRGSEGEVAFGQRMGGVGVGAQKARFKNRNSE